MEMEIEMEKNEKSKKENKKKNEFKEEKSNKKTRIQLKDIWVFSEKTEEKYIDIK